jgi:hypothetical protein
MKDKPAEITAALESLHEHLKGVEHIVATTTFGPRGLQQYGLTVIGEPGIDWDRVPTTWQGYQVEHFSAQPRRSE